ncbi:MAG: CoA pyrophosphatase [Hyphomicrobiales bacterium]|nr:CoA pyrophosphatase [Hyphomicrobiales bacterium]
MSHFLVTAPHCSSWIAPLPKTPELFSFDDFAARTSQGASPAEAWPEDAVANMLARHPDLKLAAVLIPVIAREQCASVLFTRRADHLSTHAGQISFPGGKLEPGDASPIETALREAEEEIGLDRRHVRALGFLDPHLTGTGFQIVPVLAAVYPQFTLTLDPSEVAETFEAPLDFLMTPTNYQEHRIEWRGQLRVFQAVQFGGRFIWGATAAILLSVYERLYRECRASS